ncbi:major facilitator superfamily domain-containing protein 6 isoform X2 [Condylostylus longicornis]|uniref:major facilitator superfamily domain-containing protein 6 isoform X2 n=1 Tax=Condylostylus longicornis TaxID=2530218 RepID=UPI00244DFF91|nr:major facilitator superfamily domain-containing protein 6 isoform X2 [Condylostylus longicornis]
MRATVDKKLLPIKAHYFLFNAGTAPVVPFMPTLARQLGFSTQIVGTIYAVLPIIGMLTKPLFGWIADKYQRHKILFILAQLLTAISFFCIMFIPPVPTKVELDCNEGANEIRFCPKNPKINQCIQDKLEKHFIGESPKCQMICDATPAHWDIICKNWNVTEPNKCNKELPTFQYDVILNMSHILISGDCIFFREYSGIMNGINTTMYCPSDANKSLFKSKCELICEDKFIMTTLAEGDTTHNESVSGLYQFWIFFSLLITSWAGMAVVVSVGDAICFAMLGDRHHLYGNQRLWGAVGWGIFSIIAGLLVDKMSGGSPVKDYTIIFYMALIIIIFDMFASTRLEFTESKFSTSILKDVGKLFLSFRVIIFFIWCVSVGLCTALIWNFLFWHLEDLTDAANKPLCEPDYMKTLQGFAMGIQCFGGELPFFFLSGWILKKIGHINAMSLVLFGFSLRFILYSILSNPWWVLPIELLNGITFGIFYSTMASYASIVAPPGTEATLQGMVGAIFEGVGVSIGSFIGGLLFNAVGGSITFLIYGVCAFIVFLMHVGVQYFISGNDSGYSANYNFPSMLLDDQDA